MTLPPRVGGWGRGEGVWGCVVRTTGRGGRPYRTGRSLWEVEVGKKGKFREGRGGSLEKSRVGGEGLVSCSRRQ